MKRTVGTILLAVVVVLAGCSGILGGNGEPTETLTPAPVPTDKPTPTPVPHFAPGITRQGIENVSALVAAHTSFLQNRSFTTKSNSTILAPNGSVIAHGTGVIRAGPPGKGVHSVSENNDSYGRSNFEYPVRTEVWSKGDRLFLKRTYTNGTTTYDRFWDTPEERYGAALRLGPFGTANTSVTKQEHNGSTLYLVRGNRQSNQFGPGNVSLRLLVDGQGVIHSYRTVRWIPSDGNVSRIIQAVQFSKIGTTDAPERPSWVNEAMNRTTPLAGGTTITND